jgi:hypothetical protein
MKEVKLVLLEQDFNGPLQKVHFIEHEFDVQLMRRFLLTRVVLHHFEPPLAHSKETEQRINKETDVR